MNRRPRRGPGIAIGGLALAAALLIGLASSANPEVIFPLLLEGTVLGILTWALIMKGVEAEARSWAIALFSVAILVRVVLALWVHFSFNPYTFAPDALTYETFGLDLLNHLLYGVPLPDQLERWQIGYFAINAFFHLLFGGATMGAVILNVFASGWTAILVYLIGRDTLSPTVGRIAAVLTAFYPSLILWSVLNIRDSLTSYAVVFAVFLAIRLARKTSALELSLLALNLIFLSTLRDYMAVLVGLGVGIGILVGTRTKRVVPSLIVGTVAALGVIVMAEEVGLLQRFDTAAPLTEAQAIREGMQIGATSSYAEGVQTTSAREALQYLPLGLAFFFFSPFPWAITSFLQAATLPEVMLWYSLVPITAVGVLATRSGASRQVFIPVALLILISSSYALVEGNFGTAYRHRAQVMPLIFLFTAVGLLWLWRRFGQYIAQRKHTPSRRSRRIVDPRIQAKSGRGGL